MPVHKNSGFTLVELLVVIAIIAVLSVIGIVVFTGIQKGARDSKRRSDINAISKAYEVKYNQTGTYQALEDSDFASGKIPTPYEGGSYFVYVPNVDPSQNDNFALCASLQDNTQCAYPSSDCICVNATQGNGSIDFLSQAPNVIFSDSFEIDSDNDGLANGWTKVWVVPLPGSIASYSRVSPGFDKNYSQKVTNAQTDDGLYYWSVTLQPNTKYTYSAWVKLTGVTGSMGGVDIRVAFNSGACPAAYGPRLTQLNQYTRLSVTFTTCNATTVWATLIIRPVEASGGAADTASYEADAVQIVKEN